MPEEFRQWLRCPTCKFRLRWCAHSAECTNRECGLSFPVRDGVPILIDEKRSIFRHQDCVATFEAQDKAAGRFSRALQRSLPTLSHNLRAAPNYEQFARVILEQNSHPIVLIVGVGDGGEGLHELRSRSQIRLLGVDVSHGPLTQVICDAHDLPFADETFDGCIVQAVLHHVPDPYRCVDEIHRVLRKLGLVYAELPFMQQVHWRAHDFTRFTRLGQRRLFRRFEELRSGAASGPGMALAWAYKYFLMSWVNSRTGKTLMYLLAHLTGFWVRYFDFVLIDKVRSEDAAAALFFLGRKSDDAITDAELLTMFR